MTGRVVVLDEGQTLFDLTRVALAGAGWEVRSAGEPGDVMTPAGDNGAPTVVVLDACLPCPGGPPELIRALRREGRLVILQVSGCEAVDAACRSHPVRADGFLTRPFPPGDLLAAVERLARPRKESESAFGGIHARTAVMERVFEAIRMVAPTDSTVLIFGETGTGKEMVARAIHDRSAVAGGPFVPVDCGSLAESLLASELFGYVKGAFTGANGDRRGLVEAAQDGTLFLDEVGNMPPRLQMLLLRAIQERRVRRVGSTKLLDVNARFLAATSRDLSADVHAGAFREDLFYRLNVFPIRIPPLRERPADIGHIARIWLAQRAERDHVPAEITPATVRMLNRHPWPGNVRELLGVLEGAFIRAEGGPIAVEHLPDSVRAGAADADPNARLSRRSGALETTDERARIEEALAAADGSRARAAELLGISRTTLWRRMRSLGIEPRRQRSG